MDDAFRVVVLFDFYAVVGRILVELPILTGRYTAGPVTAYLGEFPNASCPDNDAMNASNSPLRRCV
jgi:hypothetical protein